MTVPLEARGLMSGREAARYLGRRQSDVIDLVRNGVIGGAWRDHNGWWRIPRASLDAYIKQQQVAAGAA